ncbi:histidine kinase-like ATPase, partial [Ochromonadaceae sp. CCMP2298]
SGIFVLEFAFVSPGEVLQRSMAAFLLQARDKSIALTLHTIMEDGTLAKVGGSSGNGSSWAASGTRTGVGNRRNSIERMETGLCGLELDPRYQLIGDGSRLGQVLRNLLSNAIKFTNAEGTVTVTVQRVPGGMPEQVRIALPEEQRGLLSYPRAGSVRICVVDSGAGLSAQQVLDIGKEGLQFNASALQGGGGSGLGIFISKGLVQQHGGLMTVTSPGLGRGVSTTLEFPLFDAVDDHDEFPQPLADIEEHQQVGIGASLGPGEDYLRDYRLKANTDSKLGSGASRGASAYLLSEAGPGIPAPSSKAASTQFFTPTASSSNDATSNRKLLVRIFKIKGFVCQEARDGQVALQKYADMCAQGTPPCAIFMDFEMPVLNGPSATRLLREQGCTAFILGVTGNVMKADMDYFKSCGADAVFAKPLTTESVEKVMARIAMPRAEAPAAD